MEDRNSFPRTSFLRNFTSPHPMTPNLNLLDLRELPFATASSMSKRKTRKPQGVQPREGQVSLQTRTAKGRSDEETLSTLPADFPEVEPCGSNVFPSKPQPSQVESSHSKMASMGGSHLDPDPLYRLARSAPMLNKILATICKAEGLASAGVKVELQNRICDKIKRYATAGDVNGFERIKAMLEHPDQYHTFQANSRYDVYQNSPSGPSGNGVANNYNSGFPVAYRSGIGIQFKPSPFYTILQQLGDTKLCEVMAQHRHTVGIQVKPMDYNILQNVQNDKTQRVMVFACEAETGHLKHDVGFPYQSEIKVNGGEVKANLRGLKNRPGSTRPVDITDALRLRQTAYSNNIEMTYALTQKAGTEVLQKFYMMLFVVKTVPVADLVTRLNVGKRISKESVIREMLTKAQDPDIVATSTVLSLKCPLSASRINLPCRSTSCQHTQCFDATSYLQLQEQGPTWSCPICSKPAPFDNLAVDEYVQNILSNTSRSVEQVTIEPDGRWNQHSKASSPKINNNNTSFGSDDEELIEIKDTRVAALKTASTPVPSLGSARTPPMSSREASASATSTYASTSSKRPASQIIDLTLSDDDDDMPISRPAKRQFTGYGTPQSISTAHSAPNGVVPRGMINGRSSLDGS